MAHQVVAEQTFGSRNQRNQVGRKRLRREIPGPHESQLAPQSPNLEDRPSVRNLQIEQERTTQECIE